MKFMLNLKSELLTGFFWRETWNNLTLFLSSGSHFENPCVSLIFMAWFLNQSNPRGIGLSIYFNPVSNIDFSFSIFLLLFHSDFGRSRRGGLKRPPPYGSGCIWEGMTVWLVGWRVSEILWLHSFHIKQHPQERNFI